MLLVATGSDFSHLTLRPEVIAHNAFTYGKALSIVGEEGRSRAVRGAVFVLVTLLVGRGTMARLRRGAGLLELLPVLYMIPLVLFLPGGYREARRLIAGQADHPTFLPTLVERYRDRLELEYRNEDFRVNRIQGGGWRSGPPRACISIFC